MRLVMKTHASRMLEECARLDDDRGGFISAEDLEMALLCADVGFASEHVRELLREMKIDRKREVDYRAFIREFVKVGGGRVGAQFVQGSYEEKRPDDWPAPKRAGGVRATSARGGGGAKRGGAWK
jgi:hypothetical protein